MAVIRGDDDQRIIPPLALFCLLHEFSKTFVCIVCGIHKTMDFITSLNDSFHWNIKRLMTALRHHDLEKGLVHYIELFKEFLKNILIMHAPFAGIEFLWEIHTMRYMVEITMHKVG